MGLTQVQKVRKDARILSKELTLTGFRTEYSKNGPELLRSDTPVSTAWLALRYERPYFALYSLVKIGGDKTPMRCWKFDQYLCWDDAISRYKEQLQSSWA